MSALRLFSWLAVVIYSTIPAWWLAIHPFTKYWRQSRRSPYRALVPLWFAMWIAVAAITLSWRSVLLYRTPWGWLATIFLLAISISIYRRTTHAFGRPNLIGQAELRPQEFEQKLITTGLHARVRHPIYLAHLCTIAAFTIGSGMAVNYALLGFAIVTGAVMIRLEEKELAGRFGDDWRDYKRRVPAIIPHQRRTTAQFTTSPNQAIAKSQNEI